jgi:hypothetical protein
MDQLDARARAARQRRRRIIGPATKLVPSSSCRRALFRDVLLVETEYWDPSINANAPLLAYQDYYARGVGLLRSVTKNVRWRDPDGQQTLLTSTFRANTRTMTE